jgi:hypothetical protein
MTTGWGQNWGDYNPYKELEVLFQKLTMAILGMDETDDNASKVRIAWPPTGQPGWKREDDIVSLKVFEVDDKYNRQRDTTLTRNEDDADLLTLDVGYTRVNAITWVFYGPNAYFSAQVIREMIFREEAKRRLAQGGVYLIPEVPAPVRVPELFQGQWWERTDLTIHFNELVERDYTITTIKIVPITIVSKDGTETTNTLE